MGYEVLPGLSKDVTQLRGFRSNSVGAGVDRGTGGVGGMCECCLFLTTPPAPLFYWGCGNKAGEDPYLLISFFYTECRQA
jgi:hypothetical protein